MDYLYVTLDPSPDVAVDRITEEKLKKCNKQNDNESIRESASKKKFRPKFLK